MSRAHTGEARQPTRIDVGDVAQVWLEHGPALAIALRHELAAIAVAVHVGEILGHARRTPTTGVRGRPLDARPVNERSRRVPSFAEIAAVSPWRRS